MSKIFNYKPDEIDIKLFFIDGNDKEKFKPFPLNDRFLVSNMARCYDTKNKKFLKDYFNSSSDYGTWYIGDWTDNELERRSISLPIHKVVAETWCNKPPTDNRLVIDHIDGNKKNNLAENLRFVSYSENLTSQNVQEKKAETLRKNTEHRKEIMTLTKLLSKANNKIEELEKKIAELELGNKILISDNIKYIRMLDEIDEANMFSKKNKQMSKIFGFYSKGKDGNDVDRVWYQSSNIKFSECIDNDNDLKTLKVVFNNGTQYQYNKVDVRDYLFFKNDSSQGKALNQFIKGKGYEYEKLEDADVKSLEDELNFRMEGGTFIFYDGGKLTMKDSLDKVILEKEVELTSDTFDVICDALNAVGKELYVDGKNFKDGQE